MTLIIITLIMIAVTFFMYIKRKEKPLYRRLFRIGLLVVIALLVLIAFLIILHYHPDFPQYILS